MQPPRGTQDLLPPISERFWAHQERSARIFERAGYRHVVTPMFEETGVFTRGVGASSDIVAKEMYTFTDRSENSLTLRPEGTAPVMRAVISNHLWDEGLPLKLWYAAAMFRYDRPQKGRYRQHHQLGIEAIGSDDPRLDVEVIEVGRDLLETAGVSQWTLLLNSVGHPGCRAPYMPTLLAFLEANQDRLDDDCRRRMTTNPLRVFDCKNERDQRILDDAPTIAGSLCDECAAHFDAVQAGLTDAGIEFVVSPRLVRGLDYYTRTAFEFTTDLLDAASQVTVLGGGRYDGLSESLGGPALPGIGFGSGIERILLAAEAAGDVAPTVGVTCFVVPMSEEASEAGARLTRAVRAAGVSADMPYAMRGLKAHLRHADRIAARFVALLGDRELAASVATLRDMTSGEQIEVPLENVPRWLEEKTR